jgi:transcriptional regulator with XRE-family HTH domain
MSVIAPDQVHLKELSEKREGQGHSRVRDVDRHVGARIRQRRINLGINQQELAQLIGVSNQQAHKYEKGINRITAGRLYVFAQALGVDIGYFFEGLNDQDRRPDPSPGEWVPVELVRDVASFPEQSLQSALGALVRAMATTRGDLDAAAPYEVKKAS